MKKLFQKALGSVGELFKANNMTLDETNQETMTITKGELASIVKGAVEQALSVVKVDEGDETPEGDKGDEGKGEAPVTPETPNGDTPKGDEGTETPPAETPAEALNSEDTVKVFKNIEAMMVKFQAELEKNNKEMAELKKMTVGTSAQSPNPTLTEKAATSIWKGVF